MSTFSTKNWKRRVLSLRRNDYQNYACLRIRSYIIRSTLIRTGSRHTSSKLTHGQEIWDNRPSLSVKETKNLSSYVLSPGLVVVHNSSRCCQNNVSKLQTRNEHQQNGTKYPKSQRQYSLRNSPHYCQLKSYKWLAYIPHNIENTSSKENRGQAFLKQNQLRWSGFRNIISFKQVQCSLNLDSEAPRISLISLILWLLKSFNPSLPK